MLQNQNHTENHKIYQKTNGCTQKPSLGQVSAIVLIAIAITLHSLIINNIQTINQTLLFIMFALHYVFLLVIIINYILLLIIDPVDPRLLTKNYQQKQKDKNLLVYCQSCQKNVHVYSYHCKRCQRCCQQFDHHCVYVNNCIGSQNYVYFFILLLSLSIFLLLNIGEGIWVFVQDDSKFRWIALALAIQCFLILCPIVALAIFHCYISCFLYKTTLQVIRQDLYNSQLQRTKQKPKNRTTKQSRQTRETVWINGPSTETNIKRQDT